jgi:hypothetical protein
LSAIKTFMGGPGYTTAMTSKWIVVATLAGLLAVSGCKKDKPADATGGSGSAPASGAAGGAGGNAAGGTAAGGSAAAGDTAPDTTGGSAAAAGGGGAGAAMSDADIEAMINQLITLVTDIGKAVEGKDCKAAAAARKGVLDSNKPFLDKMASHSDDKALEARAEKLMEEKGYEDKLEAAAGGLEAVGSKCRDDADFMAAMEAMGNAIK